MKANAKLIRNSFHFPFRGKLLFEGGIGKMKTQNHSITFAEFRDQSYLKKLSGIADNLSSEFPRISESVVGGTIFELLQTEEKYLGYNSPRPRPFSKLPRQLLFNFNPYGSVYKIVRSCLQYQQDHDWPEFILGDQESDVCIDLLSVIWRTLQQEVAAWSPSFYLDGIDGEMKVLLESIISKCSGVVTEDQRNANFIVVDEECQFDDSSRCIGRRIIENESMMKVHWCGYPNSYDEWIPANEEVEMVIDDCLEEKRIQRRVSKKFILDCEIFNEWGNSVDYEVLLAEDLKTKESSKKRKLSVKSSKSSTTLCKNEFLMKSTCPKSFEIDESLILDLSTDQEGNTLGHQMSSKRQRNEETDQPPTVDNRFPKWYSPNAISVVELKYLASLFDRIDVQQYLDLREFIIKLYWLNPRNYLSATSCRRKIAGDLGLVAKVHSFADSFGLINQMVMVENRPSGCLENFDEYAEGAGYNSKLGEHLKMAVAVHKDNWDDVSKYMKVNYDVVIAPSQCCVEYMKLTLIPVRPTQKYPLMMKELLETQSMDYVRLRIKVLEEKVNLFESVSKLIDVEQLRVDLERRDIQIIKAELNQK